MLLLQELMKMPTNRSFEEKLSRLEEIVRLIESDETPLEKAIELYAEAANLASECNKTLKEAELTLKEIKVDNNDN